MSKQTLFKPAIWIVGLSSVCGVSGFFVFLAPIIVGFLWDTIRLVVPPKPDTTLLPGYFLISQAAWCYYFLKALPMAEFKDFWTQALRPATIGFEWAAKKPKPALAILFVAFAPTIFVLLPVLIFVLILMEPPRPRSLESIMLIGIFYMLWGGAVGASLNVEAAASDSSERSRSS